MAIGIGILSGVSAVFVALLLMLAYTKKRTDEINAAGGCPVCHADVPVLRRPASLRQALWGGWTCEGCSTELDRNGVRSTPAIE